MFVSPRPFQTSLMFAGKAWSLPKSESSKRCTTKVGSILITNIRPCSKVLPRTNSPAREYLRGMYQCTIDLLFDWFGLVCFANKNKSCQFSYSWFQPSQTGGQWYSDTSPFSIPCSSLLANFVNYRRNFL